MSTPENASTAAPAPGGAAAALTAFPLAVLCLSGASLLSGGTYVTLVINAIGSGGPSVKTHLVLAALLSAAFAGLALVLARRGLGQVATADPVWVTPLLRAASFLAVLVIVLQVITALLFLTNNTGFYSPIRTNG